MAERIQSRRPNPSLFLNHALNWIVDYSGTPSTLFRHRRQKTGDSAAERQIVGRRLQRLQGVVEQLMAEDQPLLNTMRFRRGIMAASDRHCS